MMHISKIEIDVGMFRILGDCDIVDLRMIVEYRSNKFNAYFNINGKTFGNIFFKVVGSDDRLPTVNDIAETKHRNHKQIIQDVKQRFTNVSSGAGASSGSTVYILNKYKESLRLYIQGGRQKPTEEFSVRSHYRQHYKGGKVVQINQFTKYKDSDSKHGKAYKL